MSLIEEMTGAAGIAALVLTAGGTAGAYADADLTTWSPQDTRTRIEQQAPRPTSMNAPMSHWRPFFLQGDDAIDPAFSTLDRTGVRITDRHTRTGKKAAKPARQAQRS